MRLSLRRWFRAVWLVTSSEDGVSSKELQRELGIGYHASWLMLHKLRLAMQPSGSDEAKLRGDIEINRTFLGRPQPDGKRASEEDTVIIAIAVERDGNRASGRARLQVVADEKAKTLLDFVQDTCEPCSTIYTNGWGLKKKLSSRGSAR